MGSGRGASEAAYANGSSSYGPVNVLEVAPMRSRTRCAIAEPAAAEPPRRIRRRFVDRFDDHVAIARMSRHAGERSGRGPNRSSAAISTASFAIEAAGNEASEFQPAVLPVRRSWTHKPA